MAGLVGVTQSVDEHQLRRAFDLAIAATAKVHGLALLTLNGADFKLIEDLVEIRSPDVDPPAGG